MDSTNIDWFRIPVEKEVLKRLTRKSDLKGWLQAGSFLLIFAATTAAALHELSHGTVFKTKPLNELFYHLFCFLTWNNPVHFRASHMLHHQFTVYRGRDKEVIQGPVAEKLNWGNCISWFTFDFTWFWNLAKVNVLHALGDGDLFSWDPLFPTGDPRRKAMIRWARFALIGYLVLLAVFIAFKLWMLIYLLVFGGFFGRILANLTGAIQHTEHHIYAAVPCFNLAKLHKEISSNLQASQESFLGCPAPVELCLSGIVLHPFALQGSASECAHACGRLLPGARAAWPMQC